MTQRGVLTTGTILDSILARTGVDIQERVARVPPELLEQRVEAQPEPSSLFDAMVKPGLSLIAEIKRASPSKGRFPVEIDAPGLALEYAFGGADGISVLTDEPFFEGSLHDLESVRSTLDRTGQPVPLLRKDFILSEYQILEARASGASAVLLIVAALNDATLARLLVVARRYGLDALVEVHDEEELTRAIQQGATLIGVNNRNLHTFEVDLAVSERLAARKPAGVVMIGESGIFTSDDAKRLASAGVDGILVGESLVVAADRAAAIAELKRGGDAGHSG